MPALELVSGMVTAPGSTLTAWTMQTANTLQIRAFNDERYASLVGVWGKNQANGLIQIKSPRMHDNVRGITDAITIGHPQNMIDKWPFQKLYTQDTLTVLQSGSGTAGDIELGSLLIYYPVLQGVDANMIDWMTLNYRALNLMSAQNTITTTTAGNFSGQEAINAEFDNFKANTDYALLGYTTDTLCGSVRYMGIDTGNLGVGGPGDNTVPWLTKSFFVDLSMKTGYPCIPVMNSQNKSSFLIDVSQDENGADPTITTFFMELGPARGLAYNKTGY